MDLYVLYTEHDIIDILYTFVSVLLFAVYLNWAWKQCFAVGKFFVRIAVTAPLNRLIRECNLIGFWLRMWLLKVRNKVSSETACSVSV